MADKERKIFVNSRQDAIVLVVNWNDFDGHEVRTSYGGNRGFYDQALILRLIADHEKRELKNGSI